MSAKTLDVTWQTLYESWSRTAFTHPEIDFSLLETIDIDSVDSVHVDENTVESEGVRTEGER